MPYGTTTHKKHTQQHRGVRNHPGISGKRGKGEIIAAKTLENISLHAASCGNRVCHQIAGGGEKKGKSFRDFQSSHVSKARPNSSHIITLAYTRVRERSIYLSLSQFFELFPRSHEVR